MQLWCRRALTLILIVALTAIAANSVKAQGWGTIKGQVVWDGKDVPKRTTIDLGQNQDKAVCLKKGPLLEDKLVVNAKNKGVRWCVVYLMDVNGFDKAMPIHPKLKAPKSKTVEIDQPCCQFEPHVLAMRTGQTLVVKNSATIPHNVNFLGGVKGPTLNQILPPGGQMKLDDIAARHIPMEVQCNIHRWMSGRIAVFKHPYFAVTDADGNFEMADAPAGAFRLVAWHENVGWVAGDGKPSKLGKKVTIKANDTTNVGKIAMKPSD